MTIALNRVGKGEEEDEEEEEIIVCCKEIPD